MCYMLKLHDGKYDIILIFKYAEICTKYAAIRSTKYAGICTNKQTRNMHICIHKNTICINMHKICINMQNQICINMHFRNLHKYVLYMLK